MNIIVVTTVLRQAVWEEQSGTDGLTLGYISTHMHTHARACTQTHTHTHRGNEPLTSYSLHTPWPVLPDAHVSSFCNLSSAHASLLACVLSAALSQWMLYGWLQSYWLHDPGWHLSYWPARRNISTSLEPLRSIHQNTHIYPQNTHIYTWTKEVLHKFCREHF